MHSNSDFILNFAQKSASLRELTHQNTDFKWKPIHQKCFESLIQGFKKDRLLQYYGMTKKIFVMTDAHITGFGAILAQGDDLDSARPVVIASKTTLKAITSKTTLNAEIKYPQLDLEATAINFALCRF